MCRHACPVAAAEGRESLTPQSKVATLREAQVRGAEWSTEALLPIWGCTGCRHCTAYCDHGIEPAELLFAGRNEAVRRGAVPAAIADFPERFRRREARLGPRMREIVPPDRLAKAGTIGFWPGCDAVDKHSTDLSQTLQLFDLIESPPITVVDSSATCAGYTLLAAGFRDMFRWHASKVAASLAQFESVVTGCSACVTVLRNYFPAEGVDLHPTVIHTSEFLWDRLDQIPERADRDIVYYHDPCYLGRHENLTAQPRAALAKIAEVREFAWSHSDADCCGGAGVVPKTMPATADAMAKRRLGEIARKGGGTVVTGCPTCTFMLQRNAPPSVQVRELTNAIHQALNLMRP